MNKQPYRTAATMPVRYLILLLITGCGSSQQLANIEHEEVMLRDRLAAVQKDQQEIYIELLNAKETLRQAARKAELDWPQTPCKAE